QHPTAGGVVEGGGDTRALELSAEQRPVLRHDGREYRCGREIEYALLTRIRGVSLIITDDPTCHTNWSSNGLVQADEGHEGDRSGGARDDRSGATTRYQRAGDGGTAASRHGV